jgi:MFS family permease
MCAICRCCCRRIVASCFALIHDTTSFFVLRLLLGLFEAGATPAMWYSLSQFYPQERCGGLQEPAALMQQSRLRRTC